MTTASLDRCSVTARDVIVSWKLQTTNNQAPLFTAIKQLISTILFIDILASNLPHHFIDGGCPPGLQMRPLAKQ